MFLSASGLMHTHWSLLVKHLIGSYKQALSADSWESALGFNPEEFRHLVGPREQPHDEEQYDSEEEEQIAATAETATQDGGGGQHRASPSN